MRQIAGVDVPGLARQKARQAARAGAQFYDVDVVEILDLPDEFGEVLLVILAVYQQFIAIGVGIVDFFFGRHWLILLHFDSLFLQHYGFGWLTCVR